METTETGDGYFTPEQLAEQALGGAVKDAGQLGPLLTRLVYWRAEMRKALRERRDDDLAQIRNWLMADLDLLTDIWTPRRGD